MLRGVEYKKKFYNLLAWFKVQASIFYHILCMLAVKAFARDLHARLSLYSSPMYK